MKLRLATSLLCTLIATSCTKQIPLIYQTPPTQTTYEKERIPQTETDKRATALKEKLDTFGYLITPQK